MTIEQSGQNEPTSVSQPNNWYANGLRFTCTQCGNCCTGGSGAVWLNADELTQIANYLQESVGSVRYGMTHFVQGRLSLREHPNGDCVYLDGKSRTCRIYPVRPAQCRTWPFWNQHLESPARWERVCEVCPGAGTGQLVTLEGIKETAQQSPL